MYKKPRQSWMRSQVDKLPSQDSSLFVLSSPTLWLSFSPSPAQLFLEQVNDSNIQKDIVVHLREGLFKSIVQEH
jgi:hypothetical protein